MVIPNVISALAVTVGPYVTGLKVLSFSKEYYFVEGPLRVFPFCVALFYLLVLVIATLNLSAVYIRNHLREKYKALDS